jgi:glycosyltransferase involved in cell wall biosynthesis
VHTFGKPKPFVVQAIRSAHALRIPVIYEELAQVSEDYAARPDHRDFSRCSNLCTRIVTLAQRNTDDIRRWFGFEGDAEVIDQWAFFDEDRLLRRIPRAHTRPGEIVFGSLSRLGHEKGLPSLVRAFAEVYRTMPGVRLRIAGQGPLEPQLRSLVAELLPEGVVEFLRYIPDRAEFFDSIDVFVIASQEEGGPITGVEAMSAGMPIITTPVGAMPERLSVNSEALFVRTNEVNELHPAMLRVASDTGLRISLSEAAKSRYLARNHSSVQAERKRVLWDTVRLPVAVSHC